MYVFYLDGEIRFDRAMAESVAKVRQALQGIRVVEITSHKRSTQAEWEVNEVFGFNGFPSVGAMFQRSPIYRHQGLISGDDLIAAIQAASPLYVASTLSGS
mgnify:FL=1